MKNSKPFPLVEFSILAFCLWLARDLLDAWLHSPHDRFGWLAMLIWVTPLAARLRLQAGMPANALFLGAAIIFGAFGELTEFHVLGHFALALALAAWLPKSYRLAVWFIAAPAWMPVLGWEMAHFPEGVIVFSRLGLALAGAICFWPVWRIHQKS